MNHKSNKNCAWCNKDFIPSKNDARIKYCSEKCRLEVRKSGAYTTEWARKNREHVREYREKTRDGRNARRRELYALEEDRRIKAREETKEWQRKKPKKRKAQRLKQYGLSLDEYKAMLVAQGGKCAICGFSETSDPNLFPLVDHCHSSGKVRGLLCINCNQGLGKFKDDIVILEKAIKYLEDNR